MMMIPSCKKLILLASICGVSKASEYLRATSEENRQLQSSTNYCGANFADATTCTSACPRGLNSECPSGQSCFASVTCKVADPTNWCGSTYGAATQCTSTCPQGLNSECPSGQACFTSVPCGQPAGYDWLFTTTNSPNGNKLVAYVRRSDGALDLYGAFSTGGVGGVADETDGAAADPLGSQNSLIVHQDKCIFNVNAGSDSITSRRISGTQLEWGGVYWSGGNFPVSLAASGNTLYVLNAGGSGTISGYSINSACQLTPKANSIRGLNAGQTNPPFFVTSPSQISFTPNGKFLVATLKGFPTIESSHKILTYAVDANGLIAQTPRTKTSNGFTPFGFDFDSNGNLLVVEAFGKAGATVGMADAGAVSSYRINSNGSLTLISPSVPNGQTAACWLNYRNGVALTTNNVANTISSYNVNSAGTVSLNNPVVQSIDEPLDFAITTDGGRVYVLSGGIPRSDGTLQPSIVTFSLGSGGNLQKITSTEEALPLGTTRPAFSVISGVVGLALANRV
jgi:hypothetical protein